MTEVRALSTAEAQAVLAAGSRSFHLASRFLPRARRADAAVVYALCRTVDDEADERTDDDEARRALDAIRAELDGKASPRPVVAAFRSVADRVGIDVRHAHHLIDGVASDIGLVRVPDDRRLLRYCYEVAGTVGLLMCPVLGVQAGEAHPYALDLGVGMQLTNICRDVKEDAANGRVYLPLARLSAVGVDPEALVRGEAVDRAAVARVVRELLGLAERYYDSAAHGMHHIPAGPRAAILVAGRVYREIGRLLLEREADALAGRTIVPGGRKLRTALAAAARLLTPLAWGVGARPHEAGLHHHLADLPGADPAARAPLALAEGAPA